MDFDLGQIGSDIYDFGKGLLGGTNNQANQANNAIMSLVDSGAGADQIANVGKYYTDQGFYNSGISDYLGNIGSGTLDFLSNNKGLLDAGATALGAYSGYQTMQNQADYAQGLLDLQREQVNLAEAERQRQIDKEEEAQASMATGFSQSGLNSYYGV